MIPLDCFSRNENLILRKLQTEEDEENNYYSLGGDDHNDLEEDNGD